ncbi:hypothetical protein PILCRDRAFT_715237 [Piloderma croceum F 1598]|uniref:Uncharacterized protein n=1 Tax=Piloderma croceum (strain F 1598) TaxID=765440 RepID=A0A0C3EN93_PILCF|nr:hypothetical protein PILCRDRAFT_715237 [Piloderma croceum F 1598]
MTHEDDEEPRRWSSPRPYSVIDQVFERLTTLSSLLESAVELSSTLQAQHAAAQSTISALESKVTALEELVHAQSQVSCPVAPQPEPAQLPNNPTQSHKPSTNGRSPFKANGLSSARDEWENKVKAVETNLGSTAAKFDAGLASLALLQRQQQQLGLSGNRDIENGFLPHGSGNRHGG